MDDPFSPKNINAMSGPEQTRENNILLEAMSLTAVERQADYGHPIEDFTCATKLIYICLQRKYGKGLQNRLVLSELNATDIPIIMICVKLAREMNKHKRDNLVDIAGYTRTLEMVHQKLDEQKKIDRERDLDG